ncbi:MAG TPA: methyl-accepting chemotaxis protein [Vicinamibacterales bacterium]|jgi:methyl-accepting chemotaxis protein WspA|nr:methyl-accepting chemotaxis protein [Vicinamibacterales bacterium]
MREWSIRRRIFASFGVILVLMIAMAVIAHTRLGHIDFEATSVQTDSIPGLADSLALQNAWSSDFLLTQERLLQPDQASRQALETRLRADRADLDALLAAYESTLISPGERQSLDAFKSARQAYTQIQNNALRASADQQTKPGGMAAIEAPLTAEFDKGAAAIQAVVSLNRVDADRSSRQIVSDVGTTRSSVIAGIAVAVVLVFVCGFSLLQMTARLAALVGQVQQSGVQVNTSVTEIAATAKEQQATANEIAATTTEIGATSREISATSKELVRTMHDVSRVAEQSATLAGAGQMGVSQMDDTMRHVVEAAGSVNVKLVTLSEKADDISQIVTTITKVADQTNLLSLNAAIEAEKAGEYGRGFAVVATEIRRLADQTAVATYDIDQMVKAIQSAASAGVMSMDKFSEQVRRGMQVIQEVGGQLSQVIQQVQALAPRFEAVTEGMQAQATGAEQITEALTQLSEAARQTVESLNQSNLAIDELNQVSIGLRAGVSQFTRHVA